MSLDPTTSLVQTEFNLRDHDDRRHRAHPIQVIYPSSSQPCGFKLDENALCSMFNHPSVANKKVVVISIAGTLRKGKSFLLNFFLEYLYTLQTAQQKDVLLDWLMDDTQIEGFHWKGGAKRDTIGVYLWGEPILIEAASGETYAVVLMDTQGIFEGESPTDMSLTIFYLSTLLSSMQIYNIADVITEDSLLNLLFFVNYGTLFSTEMNSYAPPLQTLVFLVRDFKLADEYTYGAEGGHSYLESVLNLSTKVDDITNVQQNLQKCFREVLCYLLPHPGHRVADQSAGFKGRVSEIRGIFIQEIKKMTAFLLSPRTLKVKVLNGKAITCNRMTTLFREYFHALQSATSPNPANILDANLHMRYTDSMNNAKLAYSRGMDRACSGPSVMSAKRLYETHIKNGILAINTFERTPKLGSTTIRSNYLARLQDDLNHELEKYKKLNEAKKTRGCASAMIRCGDSFFLGISLGAATSVSIGGVIWMLQAGAATVGIVAIPISVTTILAIWTYVYFKPRVLDCIRNKNSQRKLQCKYAVINEN